MGEFRAGMVGSAALHLGIALAAVLTWPDAEAPRPPPVPVTLVSAPPGPSTIGPPAEAPPAETPPAATPAELPAPEPTPAPPPPAPAPPQARPQPRRAQPAATPARAPAARPAPAAAAPARPAPPRTAAPTPPRPAPEPAGLDLGALRNKLARARPAPAAAEPSGGAGGISAAELASAQAALVARLQELWNPNCEVPGGDRVNVRVEFRIGEDGRVDGQPAVVGGFSSDGVVRAAQERAIRAVMAAQPYSWLPKEALGVSYRPRFNAEQACRG